jgi:cell fate (sporulation/competence/biofilm development) regulator YmcA (YheA/YmcA/DUF963 family)
MDKKMSNSMRMLRDLIDFLEQEESQYTANSPIVAAVSWVKQKQEELHKLNQHILLLKKPYAKERDKALEVLVEQFLQLSGLLKSIASTQGNSDLAFQSKVTKSNLLFGKLEVRLTKAKHLITLMEEHQTEIEGFADGAQIYADMLTARDRFNEISRRPIARKLDASLVGEEAKQLLKEITLFLEEQLDPLMRSYGSGLFSGERFNSSKDFLKSVEEQFGVADASEVGSEEFDLSI